MIYAHGSSLLLNVNPSVAKSLEFEHTVDHYHHHHHYHENENNNEHEDEDSNGEDDNLHDDNGDDDGDDAAVSYHVLKTVLLVRPRLRSQASLRRWQPRR